MHADYSVEAVRSINRELGYQERKEKREKQINCRRTTLGNVKCFEGKLVEPKEISTLAEKLKHKGKLSVTDINFISQSVIQSEENILAFFKVVGALQGLVRDLTGRNAALQLAAVNCCCNLALSNEKSCLQLTNATGVYLISFLNGLNSQLLEISLMTLGNLAGSGEKPWKVLHSQGLLPILLQLLNSTSNTELMRSCLYTLTHFVRVGMKSGDLDSVSLINVAAEVLPLMDSYPSSYWLIYLLSSCKDCDEVFLNNSIVKRTISIIAQYNNDSEIKDMTALLRILGNLCSDRGAHELLSIERSVLLTVFKLLHSCYKYEHIQQETWWLVGNLINHSSNEVQLLVEELKLVELFHLDLRIYYAQYDDSSYCDY